MKASTSSITDDFRGELRPERSSQSDDLGAAVLRVEGVWRSSEARVELDLTLQSPCRRFDIGAGEAWIEDKGFHVGVKADGPVDVGLHVLVEVVESGLIRHGAQPRKDRRITNVNRLQRRIREAEG
jgi:hypothetical protein